MILPRLLFLAAALLAVSRPAFSDDGWRSELIKALKNGGAYAETEDGQVLFQHQAHRAFIPASIMKIATAACALEVLGDDYRFPTDFLVTNDNRLVIKGYGDPFLVSEELAEAARAVAEGHSTFLGIILDTSYFAPDIAIDGTANSANPYDALNGPLIANFNTVNVHKKGAGPQAEIDSAEPQTPMTPIAMESARRLPAGKQRVNIGRNPDKGARYVGELVAEFLRQQGIRVEGPIEIGETPEGARLIYRHLSSKPLKDVVRELLKFSTNFMANQIFLVLGAARHGEPATVEKGQRTLNDFLKNSVGWTHFRAYEGSGLSRKNSVTAKQMVDLLRHFETHRDLLPLEREIFRAKTGTLTGVNTLAGFFPLKDGRTARFALLVNTAGPFDYKFKLAKMLYEGVNGPTVPRPIPRQKSDRHSGE